MPTVVWLQYKVLQPVGTAEEPPVFYLSSIPSVFHVQGHLVTRGAQLTEAAS